VHITISAMNREIHVPYDDDAFFSADTKSTLQTYTSYTTQVDKNIWNRMFYNGIGGWITGL